MQQKKVRKISELELKKPYGFSANTGKLLSLAEIKVENPQLLDLYSLAPQKIAELVIARFKMEPDTLKIAILNGRILTRDEIIDEIKRDTPIGREFIQAERAWMARVQEKLAKGEYE